MPDMKLPAPIAVAEAALKAKAGELAEAKHLVERLEREWAEARVALRAALEEADAGLPQGRMVEMSWRGTQARDLGKVVILRRTPSGLLITRRVGEPDANLYKFKRTPHSDVFRQAEKSSSMGATRELHDVPSEFLTADPASL